MPIGFDTETHLISASTIIPRFVCMTCDNGTEMGIMSNADEPLDHLIKMWEDPDPIIIQNAAFDLTVLMRYCLDVEQGEQKGEKAKAKRLRYLLWQRMEDNLQAELDGKPFLLRDTTLTEKLLALSTTGNIDALKGKTGLDKLVMKYLNQDISATKEGPDIWRLRYKELDGIPSEKWPWEASEYAMGDATYARAVHLEQEKIRNPEGYGSANSESLQIYTDTALRISSSHGILTDRARVNKLSEFLHDQVTPEKMQPLVTAGILRPNGSCNTKVLAEEIIRACDVAGLPVPRTPKGQVGASGEDLEPLVEHSHLLKTYVHRQEFQKLLTAFLPNLDQAVVFTNYDVLKETGRTSSYGGNEQKKSPYNAINIQQLPRLEGVRECLRARPGYVMCSNDYTALELCSVGQVCLDLFGYSVHAERINQGYDLHTFLGSALAAYLEPELCAGETAGTDEGYRAFMLARKGKGVLSLGYSEQLAAEYPGVVEKSLPAELVSSLIKKRAVHYRTMSKPLGLGFPGMIGPKTMTATAKAAYDVVLTESQAKDLRELWRGTYPESHDMKRWVDGQQERDGTYSYETSFLKRWRAGCTYNACANGKFMQSLSADGAKLAVCWLARCMYGGLEDDHPYRILEGVLMLAFIHDETITEIPDDDKLTQRAQLIAQIQCEAMGLVMDKITFTINAKDFADPDAKPSVEPALMKNWSKNADPVWKDGKLVVWEPKEKK